MALSWSVAGRQVRPAAGNGPSSSATEQVQRFRTIDSPDHSPFVETQGRLVHLHGMEGDETDRGPRRPVVTAEAFATFVAQGGQPDRRLAAVGPDGTNPGEAAGLELVASRGPNGQPPPDKLAGNDCVGLLES